MENWFFIYKDRSEDKAFKIKLSAWQEVKYNYLA